jgi:hypothetical protein
MGALKVLSSINFILLINKGDEEQKVGLSMLKLKIFAWQPFYGEKFGQTL